MDSVSGPFLTAIYTNAASVRAQLRILQKMIKIRALVVSSLENRTLIYFWKTNAKIAKKMNDDGETGSAENDENSVGMVLILCNTETGIILSKSKNKVRN